MSKSIQAQEVLKHIEKLEWGSRIEYLKQFTKPQLDNLAEEFGISRIPASSKTIALHNVIRGISQVSPIQQNKEIFRLKKSKVSI